MDVSAREAMLEPKLPVEAQTFEGGVLSGRELMLSLATQMFDSGQGAGTEKLRIWSSFSAIAQAAGDEIAARAQDVKDAAEAEETRIAEREEQGVYEDSEAEDDKDAEYEEDADEIAVGSSAQMLALALVCRGRAAASLGKVREHACLPPTVPFRCHGTVL